MASYSLYSALPLTRAYADLVKSIALCREWGAIWDAAKRRVVPVSVVRGAAVILTPVAVFMSTGQETRTRVRLSFLAGLPSHPSFPPPHAHDPGLVGFERAQIDIRGRTLPLRSCVPVTASGCLLQPPLVTAEGIADGDTPVTLGEGSAWLALGLLLLPHVCRHPHRLYAILSLCRQRKS